MNSCCSVYCILLKDGVLSKPWSSCTTGLINFGFKTKPSLVCGLFLIKLCFVFCWCWLPQGFFSMYFSSPFLMSPRAPITTGIISVFIPHILVVSISRSLYLESFSVVFNEMFLPDGTAISMSLQVQESQTQCGLSFPCICCTSCRLDQCRLLWFWHGMILWPNSGPVLRLLGLLFQFLV